jgi:hypothetical protein
MSTYLDKTGKRHSSATGKYVKQSGGNAASAIASTLGAIKPLSGINNILKSTGASNGKVGSVISKILDYGSMFGLGDEPPEMIITPHQSGGSKGVRIKLVNPKKDMSYVKPMAGGKKKKTTAKKSTTKKSMTGGKKKTTAKKTTAKKKR